MQIRASRREPPTPQTAVAVGDVGGHLASGVGNFKGHFDGQMSDATVVTQKQKPCSSEETVRAIICGGSVGGRSEIEYKIGYPF